MATHHVCFGLFCICVVYALVYSCALYLSMKDNSSSFWTMALPSNSNKDIISLTMILTSIGITLCAVVTGFYIFCLGSAAATRRRKQQPYKPLIVIPLVTVGTLVLALTLRQFYPIERLNSGVMTVVFVLTVTISILLISRLDLFGDSIAFRRLVWKMMTWLFILSIPWEFFRLYRHQVAEQFTHTMKGVPSGCIPSEPTLWSTFLSWCTETFTWSNQHSECLKYHKAMLVEPMWEVTPLMALTSLVTRCITQPIETIASSLGNSYRLLFENIPIQWQPVMMLHIVLLTIVLVLTMSSYRIRIPLFLNIEPHHANPTGTSAVSAVSPSASSDPLPIAQCN